jgi:hypothetical protein
MKVVVLLEHIYANSAASDLLIAARYTGITYCCLSDN